jgi:uncharacterized tellurite resistance protein B-like protein
MTWLTVLASLLVLVGLTALVSWIVLYVQFSNSPEKRWRDQVLGLLTAAIRRVRSENVQLRRLESDHDGESRSLREEMFRSYLGDISANELEAYQGIGPATVAKLRGEGYVNLATLRGARIRIYGLGDKRLSDIDHAVRDLLRNAGSTFDAGACQQARALGDRLRELAVKYDRLKAKARARARAAEEVISLLQGVASIARQVTFWRWFRPISEEPLIPSGVMDAALPDLEAALREAETRIIRTESRRRDPPTGNTAVATVLPAEPPHAIPIPAKRQADPTKQALAPSLAARNIEPSTSNDSHLILLELTIQFSLGVARVDGPVTAVERDLIRQHVHQRFSYNRALLNRAEGFTAHYETAAIDLERCLGQINQCFTVNHRVVLMSFARQIVAASGQEHSSFEPFLQRLAQRLGVQSVAPPESKLPAKPPPSSPPANSSPTITSSVPQRPPGDRSPMPAVPKPVIATPTLPSPSLVSAAPVAKPAPESMKDECLTLLEIASSTVLSADLVRRQWHLLVERLAPERVASMGPEFVKLAEVKLAAVRRAVESLLGAMGEKLETTRPIPPSRELRHNPDLDDVFGGV